MQLNRSFTTFTISPEIVKLKKEIHNEMGYAYIKFRQMATSI